MSWADKVHKKHNLEKQIDRALNDPRYKEERRKHDMKVFMVYCLISSYFLTRYEGYKCKRLKRFLDYVKKQMQYIADDPKYDFMLLNEALADETGLNVLEYMGFLEGGHENN